MHGSQIDESELRKFHARTLKPQLIELSRSQFCSTKNVHNYFFFFFRLNTYFRIYTKKILDFVKTHKHFVSEISYMVTD